MDERVVVVPTGQPNAVGTARVRIKRSATAVAYRRHIEPVSPWRQIYAQSRYLNHEFGKAEPAPPSRSYYRRCCHAAGHQRAAVPFAHSTANFPRRTRNGGVLQIVRKDRCNMPSGTGHDEIVIDTGLRDQRVLLVSQTVDVIKVTVLPKWAGTAGRTCRRRCWRGCSRRRRRSCRCRCRGSCSCCRSCSCGCCRRRWTQPITLDVALTATGRATHSVAEVLRKGRIVSLYSSRGRCVTVGHRTIDDIEAARPLIQPHFEVGTATPREVLCAPLDVEYAVGCSP